VEEIVRLLDCEKTIERGEGQRERERERERERVSHPKQPYLAFLKSSILNVGKKMNQIQEV